MNKRVTMVKRMAAVGLCVLMLTGCTQEENRESETAAQALSESAVTADQTEAETVSAQTGTERLGSGQILYETDQGPLDGDQENLLLSYMDRYYEALARLEVPDFDSLFSDSVQARASESGAALQAGIREMQEADYSLVSYRYELVCRDITEEEDGTVSIFATENSVQNFAQNPETDAERYGSYHRFVLEEDDGQWYISQHRLVDTLYMILPRDSWEDDVSEAYIEAVPEYLNLMEEQLQERIEERGESVELPDTDHPYDSEGALAYAEAYVHERNAEWDDYTGRGGNCQNYVSQCLLAGGIPMDLSGEQVWKWYSDVVSNDRSASGRSSSWTGVDSFVAYAEQNSGYGLSAVTDAPYYSGQPGDLIQMGTEDNWRHTVMIGSLVENEEGETIDYLVYSNTGDLKNYPASLYGYPEYMLTRIAGWND